MSLSPKPYIYSEQTALSKNGAMVGRNLNKRLVFAICDWKHW